MLLGKTVFRVRQKGVPPLLLPTSVLQLPRCLVRITHESFLDCSLLEVFCFQDGKQHLLLLDFNIAHCNLC